MIKLAASILREYHIGKSPREIMQQMEWHEIIGLLYSSIDHVNSMIEARKEAEIKQKIDDGKIKQYWRKKK